MAFNHDKPGNFNYDKLDKDRGSSSGWTRLSASLTSGPNARSWMLRIWIALRATALSWNVPRM